MRVTQIPHCVLIDQNSMIQYGGPISTENYQSAIVYLNEIARLQREQLIDRLYGTSQELNNNQLGLALSGLTSTPKTIKKQKFNQNAMYGTNLMEIQQPNRQKSRGFHRAASVQLLQASEQYFDRLEVLKLPTAGIAKNAKLKQRHEQEMILPKLKGLIEE